MHIRLAARSPADIESAVMSDLPLPDLDGPVPLFPLPGTVLFPRAIQPLHVFEPRYRQMMADTLAGDHVIATALLKPGFEPLYYTQRAPIYATIAIGHIVGSEQVADGNYNMLLRGFARATMQHISVAL